MKTAFALFALFALLFCTPVFATGSKYEASTNGQMACDPALPIYDSNLRQRPRGAVNESTTGVHVFATCGFSWQQNSQGIEWFQVTLTNIGTEPREATCTGVIGRENQPTTFITKSIMVNPGETAPLRWTGDQKFQSDVAVSCRLPDGVGVARTAIRYCHTD